MRENPLVRRIVRPRDLCAQIIFDIHYRNAINRIRLRIESSRFARECAVELYL